MLPDEVDFSLHIPKMGRDGDNSFLFWDNNDELTIGAIGAEGIVAAAPKLIAISLAPIAAFHRGLL